MPTNNYTATNAQGVKYALVYTAATVVPLAAAFYTLVITEPGGGQTTVSNINPSNVLTSSGTLTTASLLGTVPYVIPPGVAGTVDVVANVLGTTNIYVAGTAVITGLANVGGNTVVTIDGGTASLASGIAAAALSGATVNLTNGGSFGNGSGLITALSGTAINYGSGGGTFVANAGGSLINLSTTSISGFDAAADKIEFDNLSAAIDHYSITNVGTTAQTILLFSNTGAEIGSVTIAGTSLATGVVNQGQSGPLTVTGSGTSFTIDPGTSVLVCFLSGTRIGVPQGWAAVETLKAGDLVLTADGRSVPIQWVGITETSTLFLDATQVMPIRIQMSALGDNIPLRDLYVSPGHSMYLDGVLVPALLLVNGQTITQCRYSGPLSYYHVEVEPHDLLVAEGAATESFLDIGNRKHFAQRGRNAVSAGLEPKTWEDACAPLILTGSKLDDIRARLQARAAGSITKPELLAA